MNRLLSKGMSDIYLRKTDVLKFKKFMTRSVFGELQLTQISLNFKSSCCNLKIRGLGAKLCVTFPIIIILKGIMTF